jgi:phage baseplate assembly protein W
MALYNGFSTYNRYKKYKLTDFELVKQDLFNHFNIRKGEKLMNPEFGTIIWGLLFEPFTDDVRKAITDDVKRIATYDPRLAVDSIQIDEYQQGVQVTLVVTYLIENYTSTLLLNFDRDSRTISTGVYGNASN